MKFTLHKLLLIFAILLLSYGAKSQQSVDLTQKVVRLFELFDEHHLSPRTVDAKFVADVNTAFLEVLDPDAIFFSSEDLKTIDSYAQPLTEKFRFHSQAYVDTVYALWKSRVREAENTVTHYFEQPFEENKGADRELYEGYVSTDLLSMKWRGLLRYEILQDAIDSQEGETLTTESLRTTIDSSKVRVKRSMNDYFENLELTPSDIEKAFLNAIAESMDPHSSYFSNAENKAFQEELSRERELFGISYAKNSQGELVVSEVLPGSSAWLSGEVHSGDQILNIDFGGGNDFAVKGKTPIQLGKLFDEYGEEEIDITLKTGTDTERKVTLFKSKVYSDSDVIKAAILGGPKKIGYISLPDFYTNWGEDTGLGCANDLAKTVIKLKKENVEGIILDLRNNGGGSLKEAIDLSGIFIDFGPILVTANAVDPPTTLKDMNRGLIYSGPLVVMINGYSASASEVVAGALQDYNRALIVGSNSFGKATGQQIFPLAPYETAYDSEEFEAFGYAKITEIGLYRVSLETNQIQGVVPDVLLPKTKEQDFFRERDYSGAITLDSISKKMYFTPKPPLQSEILRSKSATRIANNVQLKEWETLRREAETLIENFDPYKDDINAWISFETKWKELGTRNSALMENLQMAFEPSTVAYDSEVYDMDVVLKKYNERFLDRLKSDIDLSETYEIIMQLSNN